MRKNFYDAFRLDDSLIIKAGFNPYYAKIDHVRDDHASILGEDFVNLASNNYLGLAGDKRIMSASINAIDKYGVSMCATPIATGYTELSRRTEQTLREFIGVEDAILYPSCYQANNGLFSLIVSKNDVVLIDRFAHSSLVEGVKATGCKIKPFRHNDSEHLRTLLMNSVKFEKSIVVTESVFSTEGSIAPFNEINALCNEFNAIPVIDDSHGIGVIGENGKGALSHHKIKDFNGIYTTSLGKAIANSGGLIGGKKSLLDYMRYYSSHLVYSTSISPSVLAGITKAIEIIILEYSKLSAQLNYNKEALSIAFKDSGTEINSTKTPIISVQTGSEENTILFSKKLYREKILSTPFIYPSVPVNKGVVRLIPGAGINKDIINKTAEKIRLMN